VKVVLPFDDYCSFAVPARLNLPQTLPGTVRYLPTPSPVTQILTRNHDLPYTATYDFEKYNNR